MGMPQLVVTAVLVEGRSKSEVACEYGVSRRWVITLVQRYLAEGDAGLAPRSRRPLTGPQRTTQKLEDEVIAIRKDLDKNGHEAGAATIAFHLELRHGTSPAVSTIWRIISQRGFVTRNRTSAPRAAICGSPPSNPTSVGNSTSPTGHCPTAPTWKSSTSSTITPDSASAATPCGCSKPATPTTASAKPLLATAIRPACSPTFKPPSSQKIPSPPLLPQTRHRPCQLYNGPASRRPRRWPERTRRAPHLAALLPGQGFDQLGGRWWWRRDARRAPPPAR
jgi:transposase